MQDLKKTEKLFCDKCNDFVDYTVENRKESRNILNQEEIEIDARVAICKKCGEELFHKKLDTKNQKKAFDRYREKKNILSVKEIKNIRKKYNLTQKEISKLLGWGEITYHRYEKGSLPDQTHNNQLRLIKDPKNVKILLKNNSKNLKDETIVKLNNQLKEIMDYKNKLEINLPGELYRKIKIKADKDGMTMSEYALFLLTKEYSIEKAKEDNRELLRKKNNFLRNITSSKAIWGRNVKSNRVFKNELISIKNYEKKIKSH